MDLFFNEDGDITLAPSKDVAVTPTNWRDDVQQVYVRTMTDVGDYVLYPSLGASLSQLYGRPNSPETGQLGINLIESALSRENRFGGSFRAKAIPIDYHVIRFDIFVTSGVKQEILLSIEQNLGIV